MPKDAIILTNEEIEALIVSIYLGQVTSTNLPLNLYSKTWDYFTEGLIAGYGEATTAQEIALIESLFQNVQLFSGAKTYQQIADFESYLITAEGTAIEFVEFRKLVLAKYTTYNKTWLSTEYNFIVESAKAAKRWTKIIENKELFDLLEYVTVGDSRVRDSHKILDGIVEPVGNAFWNSYYPPWAWSCRCTTKSHSSEDYVPTVIK